MKRTQLLVLSALVAGLQVTAAQATFPADGEDPHNLPALETYADRMARIGSGDEVAVAHATFPADGEDSHNLPALEAYSERMARIGDTDGAEVWGVSRRNAEPYDPFPSAGGLVDD